MRVCVSLHSGAVRVRAGEETCREEKTGGRGTWAERRAAKGAGMGERPGSGKRCGCPRQTIAASIPSTSPGSFHAEGSFTLAVFSAGLKDRSAQGVCWPSSLLLQGSGCRARQSGERLRAAGCDQALVPALSFLFTALPGAALFLLCLNPPSPSFPPVPSTSSSSLQALCFHS